MARGLIVVAASLAAIAVACGLDVNGDSSAIGDDASTPADAGAHDSASSVDAAYDAAAPDASSDSPPTTEASSGCSPLGTTSCFTLPNGWTAVAYAPSQTSTCPTPFAMATDVEEGPTPNDACQCSPCAITASPSCVTGAISTAYDNDVTHLCLLPGATLSNNPSGACIQGQWNLGGDVKITPLAPSGGACSSSVAKHKETFTFASKGRECKAPSPSSAGCTGSVCAPAMPPAPFAICIASPGVQASCPSGPFSVRHVVGTDVSFDCPSGQCACAVSAQCESASLTFYQDQNCQTPGISFPADNGCHASNVNGMNANVNAYEYRATVSALTCTTTPPGGASNVQLVDATTICCAQ